jgi:serine protease Do
MAYVWHIGPSSAIDKTRAAIFAVGGRDTMAPWNGIMVATVGRWARSTVGGALLGAVMAGCGIAKLWAPTPDDVLQRILPATVQVLVEQQEGRRLRSASGVAIASGQTASGKACFILTSGHTVAGTQGHRQVSVVFDRHQGEGVGKKVPATVLAHRETSDLDVAIIRAEGSPCAPASLGVPPRLGASVWVVGFPWGRHMTLASGVVSQLNFDLAQNSETAARLMIDASVSYGSSGGGVFDARTGHLIGLVEGYRTARVVSHGAGPEWYVEVPEPGQTFVVPLTAIRRFLLETGYTGLLHS